MTPPLRTPADRAATGAWWEAARRADARRRAQERGTTNNPRLNFVVAGHLVEQAIAMHGSGVLIDDAQEDQTESRVAAVVARCRPAPPADRRAS